MTDEKVFLTDERRAVLEGDYDGSDSNRRTHKSRIRKKTRITLSELIEIAESPYLDHAQKIDGEYVINPDDVFRFLRALLSPDAQHHLESGGLIESPDGEGEIDVPENAIAEVSDEFENYRHAIYTQLGKLLAEEYLDD